MAAKGKMDLAFGVALGSSTQIALFVIPLGHGQEPRPLLRQLRDPNPSPNPSPHLNPNPSPSPSPHPSPSPIA
eukprot:scaffold88794_cov54-Phaeocystis_antarctica.AAC.3